MPIVQEGCLQKNYTNPVKKRPFNSAKQVTWKRQRTMAEQGGLKKSEPCNGTELANRARIIKRYGSGSVFQGSMSSC